MSYEQVKDLQPAEFKCYCGVHPQTFQKLVSPPELPSEPTGRALSAREVRYLLSGPDRGKPEGARDYALMLIMLRLSLRVSEVCSPRASSVKWSHGRWTLRCKVKGEGRRSGPCRRT
jgi:site-specific recombinase XerD